jgi:ribonuclease R
MLPEKLSNGICSLNPNVDRYVLSCDMEIDAKGNTVDYKIYQSVIKSKHRLTYKRVNHFFKKELSFKDTDLNTMLTNALALSNIIHKYKNREGYIDFEIEEPKVIVDEEGKPVKIEVRERDKSEVLIEDFMVRANETIAAHFFKAELPFAYRIHEAPNEEKIQNLENLFGVLDIPVKIGDYKDPKNFSKAIAKVKTIRFDNLMKVMMLRTMQKAKYDNNNIGHYGLASKFYCHFTSPIRRYSDLIVHRLIRNFVFASNKDKMANFESILPSICNQNSMSEVKAVELERKVLDIKKAEYYQKFLGQNLIGQIISVQKFGFFVEFPDKVDGLVHVSNLEDGPFTVGENGLSLTNAKKTYTIGDEINVTIYKIEKDQGKIDLRIV